MTQPSDAAAAGQNHFNLLEKPWIPVIFLNGEFKRLSITEAFQQAHQIRDIASPNPMDRVAVVRFLLALLYWGQGNPPPLPPPTPDTPLDVAALLAKLQNHRQYFKLLGDKPRFYQTCDADRKTKIAELIQEIPSGNNFWHFRHVTDKQHGFCPACCALGLLRLPLFAVSGLPNLRAGINGTPPIYVIHHGQTLADTLRQNWLPTSSTSLGTPAWVDPLVRPSAQGAVPLLVGLTTLARKVWLLDDNTQGICSLCGRPASPLIIEANIATAGELENPNWVDPHVVYRQKDNQRKGEKAHDLTSSGEMYRDRPCWDLVAQMLQATSSTATPRGPRLLVVGFVTDKAKNIDVWEKTIEIRPPSSPQDAAAALAAWSNKHKQLINRIRSQRRDTRGQKSTSKKQLPSNRADSIKACIIPGLPHVEHHISSLMPDLAQMNPNTWEQACQAYRPFMEVLAKSLAPGVTSRAVQKCQALASTLPPNPMKQSTSTDQTNAEAPK